MLNLYIINYTACNMATSHLFRFESCLPDARRLQKGGILANMLRNRAEKALLFAVTPGYFV